MYNVKVHIHVFTDEYIHIQVKIYQCMNSNYMNIYVCMDIFANIDMQITILTGYIHMYMFTSGVHFLLTRKPKLSGTMLAR